MLNLMNGNKVVVDQKERFMKKSFVVAGVGFLLICLVGYLVSLVIGNIEGLEDALAGRKRYDMSIYKSIKNTSAVGRLAKVSVFGMVMVFVSGILSMIWAFRALTASKTFIYATFGMYVLGQGIGFGTLFATWKAIDLIAVFGIAGGIFILVGIVGYMSKNLLPLRSYLIWGSIFAMVIMMITTIMFFTGVYSEKLNVALYAVIGFLTVGWIAYDVWSIKKTAEYAEAMGGFTPEIEFRLTMWFGFRLLSDLVTLIWVVARFYLRMKD